MLPVRLLVLFAVLMILPAVCVLWLMNAAVARDDAAAQAQLRAAYRRQLRLVRTRFDSLWIDRAARLATTGDAAREFARLIGGELAEAAVLLTPDGHVAYPNEHEPPSPDRARLDARIARIARLEPAARDGEVAAVATRLNDYAAALPAADRLHLMDALRRVAPNVWLPTQAALRLSIDMAAAERPVIVHDVVRQTTVADIWALASADSRAIAFYRTGRIEAMMHDYLHQVSPPGVVFIAYPPDVTADGEAIAAGPWLPGWQLSFVPLDDNAFATLFAPNVRRRQTLYVSVALAGIALMVVGGVAGGQMLRRHLQIARLKTDLVAAVSHELRTPLASMRVLVDGLLADREIDPVKTREYMELMATENARLSRLIGNFLTFARLDRPQPQFAMALLDPSAILADVREAMRDRIPSGCDLRVEIAPALPPVMADREALATALINLIDNAIKYTGADKRIVIRAGRTGDGRVAFSVADNGTGIARREQRRVFRRFYRVDRRLSRDTAGVGLGLSIVEMIVRGHGGTVAIDSAVGQGSTFTILMPAAAEGAAA